MKESYSSFIIIFFSSLFSYKVRRLIEHISETPFTFVSYKFFDLHKPSFPTVPYGKTGPLKFGLRWRFGTWSNWAEGLQRGPGVQGYGVRFGGWRAKGG